VGGVFVGDRCGVNDGFIGCYELDMGCCVIDASTLWDSMNVGLWNKTSGCSDELFGGLYHEG